MGMGADFGQRRTHNLRSESGAAKQVNRAKRMPEECQNELREALDGSPFCLANSDSMRVDPVETVSNRLKVLFTAEFNEKAAGVTYSLGLVAANLEDPGTAYALDPDEICLVHRPTDTIVWGKWDPTFHMLRFEDLRLKQEYRFVFNTTTGGVFAEPRLPRLPVASEVAETQVK